MASQALPFLTPDQYLEIERAAELSEYWRGEMFAMAGATASHYDIAMNTIYQLRNQFSAKPCRVHSSDMRIHIPKTGLYTYPGVSVVCGDRRFAGIVRTPC